MSGSMGRMAWRIGFVGALLGGAVLGGSYLVEVALPALKSLGPAPAQAAKTPGGVAIGAVSGLPLPRFVSLKSSEVNVRRGAGKEYDVLWSYHRAGLPVEIIAEWDNWRRVRDADGTDGWIFQSLLSGRRTALIAPWAKEEVLPLRRTGAPEAAVVANLQPKVLAEVSACTGDWCQVSGDGFKGWIEQERLFGVYPGEQFD